MRSGSSILILSSDTLLVPLRELSPWDSTGRASNLILAEYERNRVNLVKIENSNVTLLQSGFWLSDAGTIPGRFGLKGPGQRAISDCFKISKN